MTDTGRHETPLERDDRNFAELLQELRVTQTGVQILFAFLLGLAFTQRFTRLDDFQRATYVASLLLAVVAAALFTAPAALHRVLFRLRVKRRVVEVSARFAGWGLLVLALALTASVLLIIDFVLGRAAGFTAAAGTGAVFAGLWLVVPVLLRHERVEDEEEG
ncbi:DUF6328 family protein [Wenjunlia tyrosinilytica]|jgi:hypothetical protein|uniref:Membrane protein n=1 Tax=Wenjunlia tyrosinilytica TaxID=1544741 RepID=A0A917ZRQ6_9ACTN|nr:DUF6328 family protein [Wenjunlia tyrosinilytica]GGO90294.1 membrane protein [Wenjunlia tyrosinilytica]